MAPQGIGVHVATTTRRYKDTVYHAHLLRRTYRQAGKVKHETLANISYLPDSAIDVLRRSLRGETLVPADAHFLIERTVPHGHVAAVLGTLRRLELDRLIASKRSRQRDLVVAMIVARILDPESKLAAARGLDAGVDSLADVLGLGSVGADELCAAMDWVLARQPKVEHALTARHVQHGALVLCDVTSTHFEGRTCRSAKSGPSAGGRPRLPRVNFAVLSDPEGRPVAVQVLTGHTADPMTVAPHVEALRERLGLDRVLLVGGWQSSTSSRMREDLAAHEGLRWITALPPPAVHKLLRSQSIQLSLFDERDLAEIEDSEYPGERLIVCRNRLLAEERSRKRAELLAATERELEVIAHSTRRQTRPLRGQARIALRVGKTLGRHKAGRHFRLHIEDESFAWERDTARIAEEEALDGLYVVCTNVAATELSAQRTVQAYEDLSRVDWGCRCLYDVDLGGRPIDPRLEDRVSAYIFLGMLACYVEWHVRQRLAPLLFGDEDREGLPGGRAGSVAPAAPSGGAEREAQALEVVDGPEFGSFRDLLANLATLCKNRVTVQLPDPVAYDDYTTPTPIQKRAFELLDVPVHQ